MRISDWSSDVCSSDLGTLPIDSARVVDDESALHWAWRCDVLVVGFGAAGASAAIAAHESGAKTLIVERFDGGGATARSGDRKSTRLNSSHSCASRMPSIA